MEASFNSYVEAIENGRIVKVSEAYAKREGLLVLRKSREVVVAPRDLHKKYERQDGKRPLDLDKFRKPLVSKKDDIVSELIENFQWEISRIRKLRGITRKQFALAMQVDEEDIKMIENGVLPRNDFVLISKIENTLGISLRKSDREFKERMIKEVEERGKIEIEKRNQKGMEEENLN